LKKFFIVLFLLLASLPAMAADAELISLTKLIAKYFNQSSPKSLVSMINDLEEDVNSTNPEDTKIFSRKAIKIYLKQKSLAKSLLRFKPNSSARPKLKKLDYKLKEFDQSIKTSKDLALTENLVSSEQVEIKNHIDEVMSALETDIEILKQTLLNYPNDSGVFGITEEIYGNCMPSVNSAKTCFSEIRSMDLVIREPASIRDFDGTGALVSPPELISKTSSDENGFFEINLSPGIYSILVMQGDQEFCTSGFSEDGLACLIKIEESSKTFYKSILDNAAW
jgi:hypothetical protein